MEFSWTFVPVVLAASTSSDAIMSLLKTSSWGGRVRFPTCVLVGCISVAAVNPTRAQSTTAQLSGTIYDEQRRVVADATVVIGSPATGQTLTLAVDSTGRFRAVGLVPGTYEVEVRHEGFKNLPRTITLAVGEVTDIDLTLMVGISQELDVIAEKHPEATSPRRVFTTSDIDGLPVVGRDFTNLALLVPGILQNQVGTGSSTGITASGQTGRNNIYLIDGMTLDDSQLGNTRGGLSLDTVREFVVLSNGFSAEYGQASGAVVSVVTRSGTNQLVGRAFYDHRDDAWDATPHEARLVTPPLEQAPYEQKIVGAFLGGPVVRNRMFYFGSLDRHEARYRSDHYLSVAADVRGGSRGAPAVAAADGSGLRTRGHQGRLVRIAEPARSRAASVNRQRLLAGRRWHRRARAGERCRVCKFRWRRGAQPRVGCDAAERIPRTVCQAQLRSSLTLSWLPCGGTSELQAGKIQCCAEWRD